MEIDKNRLEAYRTVFNDNMRAFAKRIGVSHAWYYDLVKAKSEYADNARLSTINKIADALGIPAKDLIK